MNVLDLFSGIGGFSLGLERAGMRTVAFCEIEPYCRAVLRKYWPDVPIYEDVRTLTAARLAADGIHGADVADASWNVRSEQPPSGTERQRAGARRQSIDLICGGFPCQDISVAGKGAGITGSRSGLWSEYARIIGEVRPRYVIVENVAALLGRGLDRVLGDLASLGYDAEWHCIPACAVGAPHLRDRLWIIAWSAAALEGAGNERILAHTASDREWRDQDEPPRSAQSQNGAKSRRSCEALADAIGAGLEGCPIFGGHLAEELAAVERGGEVPDPDIKSPGRPPEPRRQRGHWLSEPDVGRVAHGVPARVDRLRSLGNAVVPQIPEIIGKAIMRVA